VLRLATIDGRAAPTLNRGFARTVFQVPLGAVPLDGSSVAVCGYCVRRPNSPEARGCTDVRCPLVKTDTVHGSVDK
jgi:hypothetical protein